MLFVLYNACKPFNWFRKIVFSIVLVAIAALLFVPGLKGLVALDFSNFSNSEWLLAIIMILAINPIMNGITKVLNWMNIAPKN